MGPLKEGVGAVAGCAFRAARGAGAGFALSFSLRSALASHKKTMGISPCVGTGKFHPRYIPLNISYLQTFENIGPCLEFWAMFGITNQNRI